MSGVFSLCSLEHGAAGSLGTVIATVMLYPLDRIKTLLQLENPGQKHRGIRNLLLRILREEGVCGFYGGCAPMIQTVGVSNFLYFLLFQGLKQRLAAATGSPKAGPRETLAASAAAGALNMCLTEPLWRACVVAQARGGGLGGDVFVTVRKMWLAEGPTALWNGLGSSLWLVSNPVIQFFVYDLIKAAGKKGNIVRSREAFVMGAMAKALATVVTFPLQVAQSRLRAAGKNLQSSAAVCAPPAGLPSTAGILPNPQEGTNPAMLSPDLQGMLPCLRAAFRDEGLKGLYFGLLPKLLQTVTTAAFMFALYERMHLLIRRFTARIFIRRAASLRARLH